MWNGAGPMNLPRKPRGRPCGKAPADTTKLKDLWGNPLAKSDRAHWRSRFLSLATQAEIRTELFQATAIQLSSDSRLTDFRQWLEAMDASGTEDYAI